MFCDDVLLLMCTFAHKKSTNFAKDCLTPQHATCCGVGFRLVWFLLNWLSLVLYNFAPLGSNFLGLVKLHRNHAMGVTMVRGNRSSAEPIARRLAGCNTVSKWNATRTNKPTKFVWDTTLQ
jgi:hypothetical protein